MICVVGVTMEEKCSVTKVEEMMSSVANACTCMTGARYNSSGMVGIMFLFDLWHIVVGKHIVWHLTWSDDKQITT
jgi:hypothetical protein